MIKNFQEVNRALLLGSYYRNSLINYNLDNTKTNNLTGGSLRRQYEYIPKSFIEPKEAEGRKLILNGSLVSTPPNYNYGGIYNNYGMVRYNNKLKGGDLWSDISKFFKPIGSAVLDVTAPALGAFVGGPTGAVLAKGAREGVRAVTGFGKAKKNKKSKSVGVGVYSGGAINASDTNISGGAMTAGCNGDMSCAPCMAKKAGKKMKGSSKITAGAKTAGAKTAGAKKETRLDIVKRIMKEKNMKLGQASKYVKDNNLYK